MADAAFLERLRMTLAEIEADGLTKIERVIDSVQGPEILVRRKDGTTKRALNFCANNYLGLAGDARVAEGARKAIEYAGAGMASVRFICGTQAIHAELEAATAEYLGFEDSILFAAAFDANGGVFEPLLGEEDAIVSDALNHASIIDGVRLCKAKRYRYAAGDMNDLEAQLRAARAAGARTILIVTDGVFSMDGHIADLPAITALADRHQALVMVDDCHATGVMGENGRGTAAHHHVEGRVDIVTGTYGKALGGAMGGFVAARREIVALLRQRARPYLFSNALAPAVCGASLEAIRISGSGEGQELRARLFANAVRLRKGLEDARFDLIPGEHPIVPVMLGDARLAQDMAHAMLAEGVYVTGFSFPVVPRGKARIRVQLSAAHTQDHIETALAAFVRARDLCKARA
jgi:glycine C-acetyltransferase